MLPKAESMAVVDGKTNYNALFLFMCLNDRRTVLDTTSKF